MAPYTGILQKPPTTMMGWQTPLVRLQQSTYHSGNHSMQKLNQKQLGAQWNGIAAIPVHSPTYDFTMTPHHHC